MNTSRQPERGDRLTSNSGPTYSNATSSNPLLHNTARRDTLGSDRRKNDVYMPTVNRIHYRKRSA